MYYALQNTSYINQAELREKLVFRLKSFPNQLVIIEYHKKLGVKNNNKPLKKLFS